MRAQEHKAQQGPGAFYFYMGTHAVTHRHNHRVNPWGKAPGVNPSGYHPNGRADAVLDQRYTSDARLRGDSTPQADAHLAAERARHYGQYDNMGYGSYIPGRGAIATHRDLGRRRDESGAVSQPTSAKGGGEQQPQQHGSRQTMDFLDELDAKAATEADTNGHTMGGSHHTVQPPSPASQQQDVRDMNQQDVRNMWITGQIRSEGEIPPELRLPQIYGNRHAQQPAPTPTENFTRVHVDRNAGPSTLPSGSQGGAGRAVGNSAAQQRLHKAESRRVKEAVVKIRGVIRAWNSSLRKIFQVRYFVIVFLVLLVVQVCITPTNCHRPWMSTIMVPST